jgi:hypothetical protein
MRTIQIIRNGQPTKRFLVSERAEGLYVGVQPLLNADRLAGLGIEPAATAEIINSGKYDKVLPAILRMGDNGNGCVVVDAEEFDREAARRLDVLVPGLAELRSALAGEAANRESFDRAMDSEDGASCYRAHYTGPESADVADKFPSAALYLRAEDYSLAANSAKAGAGQRALARMEAGEYAEIVAREMEAEWSAAAQRLVENA